MDRFLFINNPQNTNEKIEGNLLLHTVFPSMIISVEVTGNDDYLFDLAEDPYSIIYESNYFSSTLNLKLKIKKAFDFDAEDPVALSSARNILKRAGRWFVSFLKTAEMNNPTKTKIIARNPELGNAANDLNARFTEAFNSYNEYFAQQLKEGQEYNWKFTKELNDKREAFLKKHSSVIGNYMCLLLETSSSTIEQEEWGTPGFYLPVPFEYHGMDCTISGLNKMTTFDVGFDKKGWYLSMSIIYPECLSKMSDEFWELLVDCSQFGEWSYDNRSFCNSEQAEKDFKFAFTKKGTSSVFNLIRNYLLGTRYMPSEEGSFGIGSIVVRFYSFIDFLDLSYKVQVTMNHLMKCHLLLFNERNRKNDKRFRSVRLIHENEIRYPESRITIFSKFRVNKTYPRSGELVDFREGLIFQVKSFSPIGEDKYVLLESSEHVFLSIKKTELQEAIIRKFIIPHQEEPVEAHEPIDSNQPIPELEVVGGINEDGILFSDEPNKSPRRKRSVKR